MIIINYKLKSQNEIKGVIDLILSNRGIKDIKHFLNTTSADTNSPLLLDNIKAGAQMLIKHINNGDNAVIIVDADVDGYSSSALFLNFLNCLFPHYTQNNISYFVHDGKQHGLSDVIISDDIKLIISPDGASNDFEEHKRYAKQGVDILILDHHLAEKVSEHACVINNQLCEYPNKELSGVGIVYKFCKYLDDVMNTNYSENYLDLVALGCIADMMDTTEYETQYYIQTGLKQVQNPLFKEFCAKDARHFAEHVYMNDVAWYIAPLINAVNREGTLEERKLVFEGMLEYKAYTSVPSTKRGGRGQFETLVEQAARVSNSVKTRQNDNTDKAVEKVEEIIAENNLLDHKILIIYLPTGVITRNLNGLVANKIANKYQRPTLILQETSDGVLEGSGRGYEKTGFKEFQSFLSDSDLIVNAAGHQGAFGCALKKDNVDDLINYSDDNMDLIDGDVKYDVDFIWQANHIPDMSVMEIAEYKELWGQGMPEPLVAIENVKFCVETVNFLGKAGKTLRIELPNKMSAIKFFITDEEKEALEIGSETWFGNIIATCDKNEFNGTVSPQLKIVDYEITKKLKYYF